MYLHSDLFNRLGVVDVELEVGHPEVNAEPDGQHSILVDLRDTERDLGQCLLRLARLKHQK